MSIINKIESNLQKLGTAQIFHQLKYYAQTLSLYRKEIGEFENFQVTCEADVAQSLNSKYWNLPSVNNQYYVWYNVDRLGVDPSIANKIGIQVDINEDDSGILIATKTYTEIAKISDFNTSILDDVVVIKQRIPGDCNDINDGDTGWTSFIVNEQGGNGDPNPEYSLIYGKQAAPVKETTVDYVIEGIVISDDFIPVDGQSVGMFTYGYLYTLSNEVLPADVLKIGRADAKYRRYVVGEKESIGATTSVITRWKLSSLGD